MALRLRFKDWRMLSINSRAEARGRSYGEGRGSLEKTDVFHRSANGSGGYSKDFYDNGRSWGTGNAPGVGVADGKSRPC